ncbi:MAG: permease-like cell division protein FtsX [Lachnospiraceae bacterium]|nr:permease-like cell division protein FtsX [Lachnospiraceae bacterium]
MRFSTFIYTIKQGFANIVRNKWYSLASIATISACLFLFGIFYAVVINFEHIVDEAQSGVAVTVFFDEGLSEERIAEIGELIRARSEVDHADYISAEEAWNSFKDDYLGEYADGFTENPLADSSNYQIYLNNVGMQAALVEYLEGLDGVREVNKSEVTANVYDSINTLVGYVALGIILILLLVSVFLISNTVTIGISVRKEEINIMKYIGATDFFVRTPFVVEGILIGAIGSLLPLAIVYLIYNNVISYVLNRFTVLSTIVSFLPVNEIFATLIPVSLAIGVGIGFIGSFITVRKHIRV